MAKSGRRTDQGTEMVFKPRWRHIRLFHKYLQELEINAYSDALDRIERELNKLQYCIILSPESDWVKLDNIPLIGPRYLVSVFLVDCVSEKTAYEAHEVLLTKPEIFFTEEDHEFLKRCGISPV